MFSDPVLLDNAQQYLERAWRHVMKERTGSPPVAACPAAHLLPQLLDLVAEAPHEPVTHATATIRRLVADRSFHNAAGFVQVDAQVHALVRTLEAVRHEAIHRGTWSRQPAAVPMFG